MDLLIGLDVGTSAAKGLLVSAQGEIVARARRSMAVVKPQEGHVEMDPQQHYRAITTLLAELTEAAPARSRIRAVCMACASGNTLLTDAEGTPLTPIISWLDRRGAGRSADLLPDLDREAVNDVVGWPFSGLFPLAHLAWMRRNHPKLLQNAAHVGMSNDYLYRRLTGRWVLDPSTATTFYLQDQRAGRYHHPYLEMLGIRQEQLSPLEPVGSLIGPLTAEACRVTGLDPETRVILGCFDHPAAARATGTRAAGDLMIATGTSWVGFYPAPDRSLALRNGMLIDPYLAPGGGPWGAMFSLTAVGTVIDRAIADYVGDGPESLRLFDRGAEQTPPGAGGLRIGLYREVGEPARTVRLEERPEPAVFSRALMESACLEMRRRIEIHRTAGLPADRIVMVGGGSRSPIWPRILAEVLGQEVRIVGGESAGALGAAVIAAVGAGLFGDEEQAALAMAGPTATITPDPENIRVYEDLYSEYVSKEAAWR